MTVNPPSQPVSPYAFIAFQATADHQNEFANSISAFSAVIRRSASLSGSFRTVSK
jgi:hypothetical protein